MITIITQSGIEFNYKGTIELYISEELVSITAISSGEKEPYELHTWDCKAYDRFWNNDVVSITGT